MKRTIVPHVLDMMNAHIDKPKKVDAIEFAEWLGINLMMRLDDGSWCSEPKILKVYSIEELYEKFKKRSKI
jgi:hypothetical protein